MTLYTPLPEQEAPRELPWVTASRVRGATLVAGLCLGLVCGSALAGEALWPTEVATGDCVADQVLVTKSAFAKGMDVGYCLAANRKIPDKADECMTNARAQTSLAFFTDRCRSGYFLSVNGVEYELERVKKRLIELLTPEEFAEVEEGRRPWPADTGVPWLLGDFVGGDIKLRVSNPRLIRKVYEDGQPKTDEFLLEARYRVSVEISRGPVRNRFDAELSYGK